MNLTKGQVLLIGLIVIGGGVALGYGIGRGGPTPGGKLGDIADHLTQTLLSLENQEIAECEDCGTVVACDDIRCAHCSHCASAPNALGALTTENPPATAPLDVSASVGGGGVAGGGGGGGDGAGGNY